jgi:hypothetical protein
MTKAVACPALTSCNIGRFECWTGGAGVWRGINTPLAVFEGCTASAALHLGAHIQHTSLTAPVASCLPPALCSRSSPPSSSRRRQAACPSRCCATGMPSRCLKTTLALLH